jgi:hypothetical protein
MRTGMAKALLGAAILVPSPTVAQGALVMGAQ